MKKILLMLSFCVFGFANAQTEKGSWVISGSTTLGFNSVSTKYKVDGNTIDGPKISTFTITPSVGYFVIDKLAVGLDLGFTSMTTKLAEGPYNYKSTKSTFSILPTATYYFKSDSKFMPYLGAGLGYGSTKTKEDGEDSYTVDGFSWKAKGGIAYLITDKVAVDLGLSFNQFSNKESEYGYDIKTKINTFGVSAGFSIFL